MTENMVKREIDGSTYLALRLPPKTAWTLNLRLMKMIGPIIRQVTEAMRTARMSLTDTEGLTVNPENEDKLIVLFGELMASLDPNEFMDLLVELTRHARKDGRAIDDFDVAFADSPFTAFKVAMLVVEVNFKAFTNGTGLSAFGSKLKGMTQPS